MATVTIEGSISPSTELARGERVTVQRTERVEQLIAGGYVDVVDEDGDAHPVLPEPVKTPGKGGSAEKWRAFLDEHGIDHDPEASRDELVDTYEAWAAINGTPTAE